VRVTNAFGVPLLLSRIEGGLTMGLTWRDAVSSVAILVIVLVYIAFLGGASLLLVSSAWATSAVVLVVGIGAAVVGANDLYTRPQPRSGELFRRIVTVLGTIAVIAGIAGLITGSAHALEILVVVTITMLGTATFWHVLTIGSEQ
jgi:FtsH-binding integral membrane protein